MGAKRAQPSPCTSDERGPATKRACAGGAAAAPGRNGAPPSPRANSGSAGPRAAGELRLSGPAHPELAFPALDEEDADASSEVLSLAVTPDILSEIESDTPGSCVGGTEMWALHLDHLVKEDDVELAELNADDAALIDSWCC